MRMIWKTTSVLWLAVVGCFAPAGDALAQSGGHPAPGAYQCLGGPAGNIKIAFDGQGGYAAEDGTPGTYDLDGGGNIVFATGPWVDFFARRLRENSVGMTSDLSRNFFEMTCDLR